MIPLYDNVPRVNPPHVVVGLIVLNILVFLYQLHLGPMLGQELILLHGAIPLRLFDPAWAQAHNFPDGALWTLLTYMFLHGSWFHLIMNMWMLWIFADNIEDVTGHVGFVFFYFLCGIIAGLVHLLFNAESFVPIIGASGGVAGVMGGYFVLYPHGRVATLILIFVYRLPAVIFLGVWFGMQLLQGLGSAAGGGGGEEIAWWAHVAGFVAGALLVRFFVKKDRCYYCYNPEAKHYDLSE